MVPHKELEALAVAYAVTKCRSVILHCKFIVRTDSYAVKWSFTAAPENVNKRLSSFNLLVQDILPEGGKLTIEHVPGTKNLADPFSRISFPATEKNLLCL